MLGKGLVAAGVGFRHADGPTIRCGRADHASEVVIFLAVEDDRGGGNFGPGGSVPVLDERIAAGVIIGLVVNFADGPAIRRGSAGHAIKVVVKVVDTLGIGGGYDGPARPRRSVRPARLSALGGLAGRWYRCDRG